MKVLVIGASGTVGKAILDKITSEGHEVMAVSRKTSPGVDIGDSAGLQKFLAEIDPVDHIVCTGGGVHMKGETIEELTDDQILLGLHSKLMGQINLIRYGYKKVNKGGSILITGGLLAYKPLFPKLAHVAMVNSGLNGFVIHAASDFKDSGVRINVIHPPFIRETGEKIGLSEDMLKELPPAKEAAETYVKCLFEETGTGQTYFVDGHGI